MSTSSILSRRKGTVGKTTKTLYQVTQQLEFLHLQAEVESLLQQLQFMKQQRLTAASYEGGKNHN